ncbi:hypothetical protein ACA910_015128 [Epithemia clementina (nom. ined.)]
MIRSTTIKGSKKRKKSTQNREEKRSIGPDDDEDDSMNNRRSRKSEGDNSNTAKDKNSTPPTYLGRCDKVSERYEKMGRRLGQGTYGIVYQATDRITGKFVALKRCIPHHEASDGFPVTTLREIQSLRLCSSHANIVHLENVAVSRSGVFLVFEYCDHDLSKLIDGYFSTHYSSPFLEAQVKTLLIHLLQAVNYVHEQHLIHRDIKLSNLLYTHEGLLKLADFGLSRPYADSLQSQLTLPVASLWYRPPELLLGATSYSTAIDLWGVGCIFGELLTGKPLMKGKDEMDQVDQILDCLGLPSKQLQSSSFFWELPLIRNQQVRPPPKSRRTILDSLGNHISRHGLNLVHGLLHFDPTLRWNAAKALECPYLKDESPLPTSPQQMPQFPKSFHGV